MSKVKTNIKRFNGINIIHSDKETGEILAETDGISSTVCIEEEIEKTQSDIDNELHKFGSDNFLKLFRGKGALMKKELTNNEIATIVFLSDYICFNDCILRKNGDSRGHALSLKELSGLLDVSYDNLRKTMASLKKKEVIAVHSTGDKENGTKWITVNPYFIFRGGKATNWIMEFYKDTRWNTSGK